VERESRQNDVFEWMIDLVRESAGSITPVLLITVLLPGIGFWGFSAIWFASSKFWASVLWAFIFTAVMLCSCLLVPEYAVRYRRFLSRRGNTLRRWALVCSAIYASTYGVIVTGVLRLVVQTGSVAFIPLVGYLTYCILTASWFVKLPFDVEVKQREDAAR
jgi:hypothetical protein